MPQELPGFYYDPAKNRYFPLKGPIPGSGASTASQTPQNHHQKQQQKENGQQSCYKRKRIGTGKLLEVRELCGNVLSYGRWTGNFQNEVQKIQASQSMVWKYKSMEGIVDSALEHFEADIQTLEGEVKTDFLLMGSMRGSLSLYEVGDVGKHFHYGLICTPNRVSPLAKEIRQECSKMPRNIWRPRVPVMIPAISCIRRNRSHSVTTDGGSAIQHALITTLGSETSGGTVYVLNLNEPLNFHPSRISEIASLRCTIWTADCNPSRSEAVVGTNLGARLINLETKSVSWLCRSKSDLLSLQFNQLGNAIICGYRNGMIAIVDVRQKQQRVPEGHPGKRGSYSSHKLRENINPCTVRMPSSISSMVSLETYDQYFIASSMDGSIKLYDHRMMGRGAVQSYEGNVNSHTRIQLGVDSSENFIISGGEDGKVRIWSIKTGELLFGMKISHSAPTSVCCPTTGSPSFGYENSLYEQNHSWGAWLGSVEGLFYVHGS